MSTILKDYLFSLGITSIKFIILYFVIKLAVRKSIKETQNT